MSASAPVDAQLSTSLCARSLAALEAASSCSIAFNTTGNLGKNELSEDSTSQGSSIKLCLADLSGDSTDTEGSVGDDSALASPKAVYYSAHTSIASPASFIAYPIALLLHFRASLCGSGDSDSATSCLGYSTRSASECPVAAEDAVHVEDVAPSVCLPVSKPSWSSQQRRTMHIPGDSEQVTRAARSILNKLTVEKFDALYEQLATCGMRTSEHVKLLMHEIFDIATVQHHFLGMYADLCVKLESDPRIALAMEAEGRPNSFRHLLLSQCQKAFEQQFGAQIADGDNMDDEERLLRKRRALGNVKFVGELIVRGMLSSRLLCNCAEELLGGKTVCNEALESLAALLMVTGAKFDDPTWPHMQQLEGVFSRMSELVKDKSVSTRSRFLLRDVLDLRKARWTTDSRPPTQVSGPMRLEQVRASVPQSPPSGGNSPAAPRPNGKHRSPKRIDSHSTKEKAITSVLKLEALVSSSKTIREEAPHGSPAHRGMRTTGSHRRAAHASESTTAPCAPKCHKPTVDTPSNANLSCVVAHVDNVPVAKVSESTAQPECAIDAVLPVAVAEPVTRSEPFTLAAFRRELSITLKELSTHRNVAVAVRRIRAQNVPLEHQANQFADLLTRASEEIRGPARRTAFAFCGGLAAAEQSAFNRAECLAGVRTFFTEIYPDLCEEVSKLPSIMTSELLPTLQMVLPAAEFLALVPKDLRNRTPASQ